MIIGICGYKGTGKSTVAEYLAKNHKFKRVNFKDGLVAEMKERFPNTIKQIGSLIGELNARQDYTEDELFAIKPTTFRAFMQEYGTEVRRADNQDYWVDKWKATVEEMKGNIVTDDVRFFNELAAIGDLDGILIRVTRPDVTSGGTHQSETEQEKFIEDFTINGEPGDHASIYKQIDEIINTLKSNTD